MLYFAFLLLIVGLLLLWYTRRRQRESGLPAGRIIYTDTRAWEPVEEPLYDRRTSLTGRPDYLVEAGNQIIPVEVKSSRAPEAPYASHIYQLMAYCLLVESAFAVRPDYGILHYRDRTFTMDYTREIESELHAIMKEIRSRDRRNAVNRSHDSAARCRGCGYMSICDQSLS